MDAEGKQRIDKWLFFARTVKSRALAAKLAAGGHVRVNRNKIGQAAHLVRAGDVLTITLGPRILVYRILSLGERRGPSAQARLLYEDLSPDPAAATPPGSRGSGSTQPPDKDALGGS